MTTNEFSDNRLKVCGECGKNLPESMFYKHPQTGKPRSKCKLCQKKENHPTTDYSSEVVPESKPLRLAEKNKAGLFISLSQFDKYAPIKQPDRIHCRSCFNNSRKCWLLRLQTRLDSWEREVNLCQECIFGNSKEFSLYEEDFMYIVKLIKKEGEVVSGSPGSVGISEKPFSIVEVPSIVPDPENEGQESAEEQLRKKFLE